MSEIKTFYILPSAHVCTEMILETNLLRSYFNQNGLLEVTEKEKADLVMVATCAFNQEYEDESYDNIKKCLEIKDLKEKIVVSGCYPKIAPRRFKELEGTVQIPPLNLAKVEKIVPPTVKLEDVKINTVNLHDYENSDLFMFGVKMKKFFAKLEKFVPFIKTPHHLHSLPMPDWYLIQAGNGCLGKCTFCAIKHSRGGIQSTPIDKILSQVEIAVRRGYKTVSFAATDMGCWGQDIGMELADLLKEVVKIKGDYAIDMHYVEPEWVINHMEKLEPIFQTGKIKSFGTPVQSGSNAILEKMGRNYSIEDFIKMVNHIVGKTKVQSLNSILMLGFPGESLEDYMKSYNLVQQTLISYWCVLKYEGRYNIESEEFPDKIDEKIKDNRRERLEHRAWLCNYMKIPFFIAEPILKMKYGKFI